MMDFNSLFSNPAMLMGLGMMGNRGGGGMQSMLPMLMMMQQRGLFGSSPGKAGTMKGIQPGGGEGLGGLVGGLMGTGMALHPASGVGFQPGMISQGIVNPLAQGIFGSDYQ